MLWRQCWPRRTQMSSKSKSNVIRNSFGSSVKTLTSFGSWWNKMRASPTTSKPSSARSGELKKERKSLLFLLSESPLLHNLLICLKISHLVDLPLSRAAKFKSCRCRLSKLCKLMPQKKYFGNFEMEKSRGGEEPNEIFKILEFDKIWVLNWKCQLVFVSALNASICTGWLKCMARQTK